MTNLLEPFRPQLVFVWVMSFLVNILVLVSPFFMLLLYDKVIPSSSQETLLVLTLLAVGLFGFYGVFDYLRGRVMSRIGTQIQLRYDQEFIIEVNKNQGAKAAQKSLKDLERIQRFFSSPVSIALIDLIWSPLFILIAFVFHPWLGWFSVFSICLLAGLSIINQRLNKERLATAQKEASKGEFYSNEIAQNSKAIEALGMQKEMADRWMKTQIAASANRLDSADRVGLLSTFSKSLRLIAQSGMLALGAYLVILGQIPAGMMIAGSILLGRALGPVDQVIGQWALVQESYQAWKSTKETIQTIPEPTSQIELPKPEGHISFTGVFATYPNAERPALQNINFSIAPGTALGVIGSSASGKSTLAHVLLGMMPVSRGRVDIDGASIGQYRSETLGKYFGYLPQDVVLYTGSINENIKRFDIRQDSDQLAIQAAKSAGAHDMIVSLPNGYDTMLPSALSGGQRQRVALARALYGEPAILVFDEPNSNLDAEGTKALNDAIKKAKDKSQTVIIIAHRPAAIQECDYLLVLQNGQQIDFGLREEVLKKQVQNYRVIQGSANVQK